MKISKMEIFSIALFCSIILQSKTQSTEKDEENIEENKGHQYQVSFQQAEEEGTYETVMNNSDNGGRRKRQRTSSPPDEVATTTTSLSAENSYLHNSRERFNEMGILSTTSSAGRVSALAEFERLFQEGVRRLASTLPLSEGDLTVDEKGEWYQVIAGQKATQAVGSVSTSLTYHVTYKCSTETIHEKWELNDTEKKSYEILSVRAIKGNEKRPTHTTKIGRVIDYNLKNTSVRLVSAVPDSEKFNIIINKNYERADLSKFTHPEPIEAYLTLTHVNFTHEDDFSYQIVRGWYTDSEGKPHSVNGMENYTLTRKRYEHQTEFHDWIDDKINHYSTERYRIVVNSQGAYTPDEITREHTHVGYVDGETVDHKWNLFSYTIPWSNKTY